MASDMILREELLDILGSKNTAWEYGAAVRDMYEIVKAMPAVDAVPVVHARWERSNDFNGYCHCSACHNVYIDPDWIKGGKWQYCPCCGAKMDGGEGDG